MKRALMRRIAAKNGQPTDTSMDHDFPDWDEVAGFALDLLELSRPAAVWGAWRPAHRGRTVVADVPYHVLRTPARHRRPVPSGLEPTMPRSVSEQTKPRLRGWIHAASAPVAFVVAILLWRSAAPGSSRVSIAVFGVALIGLFTISATYHLPRWSAPLRRLLSRMDVAMIQLFIAATFTPFAVHALQGRWRTWALVLAWAIAVVGAGVAVSPAKGPRWLTVAAYASFGALAAIPLVRLSPTLDPAALVLVGVGGLLYVVGGVFYALQRPNPWPAWFGYHEAFHVMVVLASAAHVAAIWRYVLPLA